MGKKGQLILVIFLTYASFAGAQTNFKIFSSSNVDITNSVLNVYQDTGTAYAGNFLVQNTSSQNLNTKLRKEEISMGNGAFSSICYSGSCYSNTVYLSPCKPHNAGTQNLITCDFNFGQGYAVSRIRYTVYNCADQTDSASFVIVYNASPAGIKDADLSIRIGETFPNPAASELNFNLDIKGSYPRAGLSIYNLDGSLIKRFDLSKSEGKIALDISELQEGMYFYTFEVGNRQIASRKFIVAR